MKFKIEPVAIAFLLTDYICIMYVFLTAYFSPTKNVLVSVNSIGEAHSEFILFVIFQAIFMILWAIERSRV